MDERKYESRFIPCGDALEKMELFAENVREKENGSENEEVAEKNADLAN